MTIDQLKAKVAVLNAALDMGDEASFKLLLKGLDEAVNGVSDLQLPTGGFLNTGLGAGSSQPLTTEKPVVYGKDGYTDQGDPRKPNARTHGLDNGKVTAVWLTVHVNPQSKYRCVNAFVIGEEEAKGQTTILISVKDKNGNQANERVIMATGYQGQADKFDDYLVPGNAYVPVQHILADSHDGKGCTFVPPALGGIAIFVAANGQINQVGSDVVGNLGLPYAHHVSYFLEFQER